MPSPTLIRSVVSNSAESRTNNKEDINILDNFEIKIIGRINGSVAIMENQTRVLINTMYKLDLRKGFSEYVKILRLSCWVIIKNRTL